ncbi:MAG: sugar ABC transporter permease, partial [Eubacteriales bacterium]|nr:sugar ABC transporter permease [Eubacteriales bacterium]
MNYRTKLKVTPWMFIAPFLVVFVLFSIYPVLYSVVLSFGSYNSSVIKLSGLRNYRFLLSDRNFATSLLNTLKIGIIQVPLMLVLALVLANFLNSKLIRGKGFFRMAVFMPVLIDAVSYSVIFSMLFNDNGFINNMIQMFGGGKLSWYTDSRLATMIIVIAQTWKWTGYNMVIILAGLQ